MSEALTWLLHRAGSYWRDSLALDEMGDEGMGAAYRAISGELTRCAEQVCSVSARTIDCGETWYCSLPGEPWRRAWWDIVDHADGRATFRVRTYDGESGGDMTFGGGRTTPAEAVCWAVEISRRILGDTSTAARRDGAF